MTEDIIVLQGRTFYEVGRAQIWKSLKIEQAEREADLLFGTTPENYT